MSWFLVTLYLSLIFGSYLSEAGHNNMKLSSATVVVGTVYCDTCSQQDFSMGNHFISGASVGLECKNKSSKPKFKKEVITNKHGEFRVQLPFSVSKHVKRINGCTVKLISSSEPNCAVPSTTTSSSSLLFKSREEGLHIFSAGFFSFKPLKQPNLCNQKPRVQKNTKGIIGSMKSLFSPFNPSQTRTKESLGKKVVGPEKLLFPKPFFSIPNVPNPWQPSSPMPPMTWQPSSPMPPMTWQPSSPPPMMPNPWQPSSPTIPTYPKPWFKFKPPASSTKNVSP